MSPLAKERIVPYNTKEGCDFFGLQTTFPDSSMVEQPAVNRFVVGSSPTRGASLNPPQPHSTSLNPLQNQGVAALPISGAESVPASIAIKENHQTAAGTGTRREPNGNQTAESDPDLARILTAWPTLPAHLRAAMLALIGTVGR